LVTFAVVNAIQMSAARWGLAQGLFNPIMKTPKVFYPRSMNSNAHTTKLVPISTAGISAPIPPIVKSCK
jgi:hypothetical protein